MDGGHRSRSFFRKVVHINGTSLRYGGRGSPLPNDSPEALPGLGLPPRRTSEKGICEILDGRVTDPPLRTSSASLRSAPSPKGEGFRAADSCSFFPQGPDTGRPADVRGASRRPRPTAQHQLSPARQSQARLWDRTNNNFGTARPQWAGLDRRKSLKFCAPEILQNLTSTRPP